MTEKQREALEKLQREVPQEVVNARRRWECSPDEADIKPKLVDIFHKTKHGNLVASMELVRMAEKFSKEMKAKGYETTYKPMAIARMWVMAYLFMLVGRIQTPIYPYLTYLAFMDWKVQRVIRDKPKYRRTVVYPLFERLGIPQQALKEAMAKLEEYEDIARETYNPNVIAYLRGELSLKDFELSGGLEGYEEPPAKPVYQKVRYRTR